MTPTPAASAVIVVAVAKLRDAGVPTETRVATLRGAFGRTKYRAAGEVWRVGALCLADDGAVFATGDVLIVTEPTHPNHRNALAVERNDRRAQLRRAGIAAGTTVVVDARPLDLDAPEPPLVATADGLGVFWAVGATPVPLDAYLAERVELLVHPHPP
ncbi:MAG: hypothetical protein WBL06_12170 [Pseudolysinimonas sp.]|uniref:hypothetical protein n=1 Tax=Pseudolysinimonas sp. TaxID=2680009 RepID=UPI003C786837